MRIPPHRHHQRHSDGVALIIVMLVMFAMAVMVGAFIYAMKIEAKLAFKTDSESELEWIGRSGVEYARWVLALEKTVSGEETYDGLNQFWAGGPGSTNALVNPLEGVSMKDVPLGEGKFSIEIVDNERYLNINRLVEGDRRLLESVLNLCGAQSGDASDIAVALKDWVDRDDFPTVPGGAESMDYYLNLNPPYVAKNGPIDTINELLKVRGITPQIFWGPKVTGVVPNRDSPFGYQQGGALAGTVGLADLVCAVSNGQVNVNTASAPVLAAALGGGDAALSMAENAIRMRAGPDGVDGTLDDMPARNPAEVGRLLGGPGAAGGAAGAGTAQAQFTSMSTTFQIHVDAELGPAKRRYIAIVRRASQRDIQVLTFFRE